MFKGKETVISEILIKDLLEGKRKYVKKGYLIFDNILMEPTKDDMLIHFYKGSERLVTITGSTPFREGYSYRFVIADGQMKMEVN